jgi:hypothetical protein
MNHPQLQIECLFEKFVQYLKKMYLYNYIVYSYMFFHSYGINIVPEESEVVSP